MKFPFRVAMLSVHTSPLAILGGKETGGMNVYVRELSRHLALRGACVDVFTRSLSPHLPRTDDVSLGARNARVIQIPAGPEAPVSKHRLIDYIGEFADGVADFARDEGIHYDLMHAHYWLSGSAAELLRNEFPRAPIIQMFHTLGAMKNRVAVNAENRETDLRIEEEARLMQSVDRIVASTERDKSQMVELYGAPSERVTVIPPGVDTALFRPVQHHRAKEWIGSVNQKTVLFVGRIDPVKGLDTWFRAMRRVVQAEPSLKDRMCVCLVGGDVDDDEDPNSELARLDRLKDELGISDIVTFLGGRAQSALPYYYSAADLVVMPSRYESFGLAALEAMACGTPVVASDVGGLSFIVKNGETGFLIPEGDETGFAEAILKLLLDLQLREQMSAKAVAAAREYAWPVITGKILDLYRETTLDRQS